MLHIVTYAYPSPEFLTGSEPLRVNKVSLHFYDDVLVLATALLDGARSIVLPGDAGAHIIGYTIHDDEVVMPMEYGLATSFEDVVADMLSPQYRDVKVEYKLYPARYDVYCATSMDGISCELKQYTSPDYEPDIDIGPGEGVILIYTTTENAIKMATQNIPPDTTALILAADDKGNIVTVNVAAPGMKLTYLGMDDREVLVMTPDVRAIGGIAAASSYSKIDDGRYLLDTVARILRSCISCEMVSLGAIKFKHQIYNKIFTENAKRTLGLNFNTHL